MKYEINFNTDQFNRLFPFFILINGELEILEFGKSLEKLNIINKPNNFNQLFSIPRPLTSVVSITDFKALENQLVVIKSNLNEKIQLRGQFEFLEQNNVILFVGSPWFDAVEQVIENNLLVNDFAKHDPVIDLLNVAKSHEITSNDLKELIATINKQKNELKKANKDIEEIALFPTQNPDPLIRINFSGEVISNNPAASLLDFIEYDDKLYRNDQFFEIIANKIDVNKSRTNIDVRANSKDYSLVCIPMLDYKYINIYGREITQQKKDQQEIERLSLIVQKTINAVIITDAEGCLEWANDAFEKITGYHYTEIKGKKPGSFLQGPETDKDVIQYMRTSIKNKQAFTCEIANYTKSGKKYWLRINAQPILNNKGETINFFAIEEDITKEKEIQQKLEQQRVFYEQILDNIPSDVAVFNNKHTYLYLNPIAVKDATLRKWLIGKTDEDYIKEKNKPIELLERRRNIFNQVTTSKNLKSWEETILLPDGNSKIILRNMYPVLNALNEVELVIGYGMDITEIKNVQYQIELSEKKYKDVVDHSLAIITTHDLEGFFLSTNPMVSIAYGYTEEEMVGKKVSDFMLKQDVELFTNTYLSTIKKEKKATGIFRVLNKENEIVYTLYNNFLKEERGEKPYVIGFAVDITERIKAENVLKKAKKATEELAQSKQNFLANMSHEIRTPMNAIMGMANQLNKTPLDTKQQFFLKTIQTASENLLVIINDVLDVSKIEAGKLTIESIGFEPKIIVFNAIQVMLHKAEEKGLILTNSFCDPMLANVLIGDPYRINQILLNLLSNAIKFTEKGSVDIKCTVENDNETSQVIICTITDTGIGMDKEFSQNIFQKFKQEDETVTRKFGGTGLGMSICKDLITQMKGAITVQSKKGEGTVVQFSLPLKKGTTNDLPQKTTEVINTKILSHKNILVVDDNEMNRLVASTILQNYGVNVHEATNGEEAIQKIKNTSFDIVLMDVQMPVMDGLQATKVIKNDLHINVPIIALTAYAVKGDKERILKTGMDNYISKPFEENNFLRVITDELSKNKLNLDETEKNDSEILYNLFKLEEIAKGNKDFINKMIELFIVQTPKSIAEFNQAYENNDVDKISKIAHRIKPSIDNLGIEILRSPIRELEKKSPLSTKGELLSTFNYVIVNLTLVIEQLKKNKKP